MWWWTAAQFTRIPLAQGELDEARSVLEHAVALARREGLLWVLMMNLVALARVEACTGDVAPARAHATEGLGLAAELGNLWVNAEARHVLGELLRTEGEWTAAEARFHEALVIRVDHGFRPGVAESLESLAALAADLQSWTEATRVLAAGDRLRGRLGCVRLPVEQARHDALATRLHEALGAAEFAAAWAEGAGLDEGEAVGLVRRARGERKRPTSGWASLTQTELQVVRLVARGLTNPQVGAELFMSLGTVKTHLGHVFTKLGCRTRAELVAHAVRRGVQSEDP
jgi:DNA-binding CsgD family transcriptional regulator